ncbi:MAG: metal-dependent phosphohydrolase [Euryarchaeota archaeon]|nr:metal-dependent phosphohydrolase [Euryarchaeota archaeon]
MKVINDAIHGDFSLEGVREELLATPEFNKLSHIKQLGLAHLIFPGAHHTRFEHSLGVSHVAGLMADSIGLSPAEKQIVQVAGMLHDVGHGPYSHTLEHILHSRGGKDHMSITEGIITGSYDAVGEAESVSVGPRQSIPEILEKHGVDPKEVSRLIRGPDASGTERSLFDWEEGGQEFHSEDVTLANMVHGPVDCDQIDYLMRDAHFTGVKHGSIDHMRLIRSLRKRGGNIAVDEGGLAALEGMLMARGLMYSAVYFHRVTRVTEVMLSRAVERSEENLPDAEEMQRKIDSEIWADLNKAGGYARDIITRLKYRKLFKIASTFRREDLTKDQVSSLGKIATNPEHRRAVEDNIAKRAGLDPGYVAVDVPSAKLLLSEPRMSQVDVRIIGDDGKTRWLHDHTPIADALKRRQVSQSVAYLMTIPGHEKKVSELFQRHLM